MSKMELYRDFKPSIDYRLKNSIKILQTFNGSQKPDTYLDWVNEEAGLVSGLPWLCLLQSIAQQQPHRLRCVNFLSHCLICKKFSAYLFIMYISIYLKIISRKCISKRDSRMSRLSMSSRAIESSFSWLRLQQAIPVREMSILSL